MCCLYLFCSLVQCIKWQYLCFSCTLSLFQQSRRPAFLLISESENMHRDPPSIFRTISRSLLCSLFLPVLLPLLRQLWPCVTCRGEGKVCRVTGMHGRSLIIQGVWTGIVPSLERIHHRDGIKAVHLSLCTVFFCQLFYFTSQNLSRKSPCRPLHFWNPQNPCKNCIVLAFLLSTLNLPVYLYENIYCRLIKSSTVLCTLLKAVVSFEQLLSGQNCRIIKCQMQELAHIRSQ